MTLSAGTRLGAYEILAPIGAGGMGEVPYWTDEVKLPLLLGLVTQTLLLPFGEKDGMRGLPSPIGRQC